MSDTDPIDPEATAFPVSEGFSFPAGTDWDEAENAMRIWAAGHPADIPLISLPDSLTEPEFTEIVERLVAEGVFRLA